MKSVKSNYLRHSKQAIDSFTASIQALTKSRSNRQGSTTFRSGIRVCFAVSALIVHTLCSHARESSEIKFEWYPQTPGQQIEDTDWRLQKESLPIWNKSWRCRMEKDWECAINHLEAFLERDLEAHQLVQVHSAIAQNYLQTVVVAFSEGDRVALDAVQKEIGKLNKDLYVVKLLKHQVAQAYHRANDWESCTKHGTALMNAKEMREHMLERSFAMLLADCFLRMGDLKAARHWVDIHLKETEQTRESMAPAFDHVFKKLGY